MTHLPITPTDILIVGTRGYLLAFEKCSGNPVWKYQFEKSAWATGSGFVSTLVDGDKLFAGCYGKIYCFDLVKGALLWQDNLKGNGFGVVSFAVQGASSNPMPNAEVDREQFNEVQPG